MQPESMTIEAVQNEFGYFGKLPTVGDFIHQVLPQDFANGFHEWLQLSMAQTRESLGDEFLTCYLNCPSWKFITSPGVCGAQAVAGITIPSVDQVGRYFNFTLATVLPLDTDPIAYVMANRAGFKAVELLALDILDSDYSTEQVEMKVRETSLQFHSLQPARNVVEIKTDHLHISLDLPLPFADQASTLFRNLGDDFSEFFELMREKNLMDLKTRDGKAGGGFCIDLPEYKVPFVFANFNGTEDDVNVFTHECGHAFQAWRSMDLPLSDYFVPTFDAAEIHSMSLEFLTWPWMERFFEGEAERFRRVHLTQSLLFLPYGTAVDHFQHMIYERPQATPTERHASAPSSATVPMDLTIRLRKARLSWFRSQALPGSRDIGDSRAPVIRARRAHPITHCPHRGRRPRQCHDRPPHMSH